jgi:hypothetical protein
LVELDEVDDMTTRLEPNPTPVGGNSQQRMINRIKESKNQRIKESKNQRIKESNVLTIFPQNLQGFSILLY